MNRSAPLAKIAQFNTDDPMTLKRALSLAESASQKKAQEDAQRAPYIITTKKSGTYTARAWDLARMDTSAGNCAVILPDPLKMLGVWIGVKFAAGVTNFTVTVSAINATIDGAATYVLNVARQIVFFYATVDGWERGSTL